MKTIMVKNILGLDLGTNSVGWTLIEVDENNLPIRIIAMGSRELFLYQQVIKKNFKEVCRLRKSKAEQ